MSILQWQWGMDQISMSGMRCNGQNCKFIVYMIFKFEYYIYLIKILVYCAQVIRRKVAIPVPAGIEHGQTIRTAIGTQELFVTVK